MIDATYRHMPHTVSAIRWTGENIAEVVSFLRRHGASKVSFNANLTRPDVWNGVWWLSAAGEQWCDTGSWIVAPVCGAQLGMVDHETFTRDFPPDMTVPAETTEASDG